MLNDKTLTIFIIKRIAIALTAIIIAGIATSLLGAQITASADAIVAHKKMSATLEMRNETASKLLADYQNIKGYDARIESALLPVSNILEFVGALESLASKDSVTQSARFSNPVEMPETIGEPPRSLYEVPFSLSLQGNIFTFLQYLSDVEHLPYFVKIHSISISAQGPLGWQNVSNITVSGTLYTQGE